MRKIMLFVLVALVVPVAAFASGTPSAASTANSLCKQAQTAMGTTLFAQTYATNTSKSNGFGKCASRKNTVKAQQIVSNAAKTCTAQQSDTSFSTTHNGMSFVQFYGASKGKNSAANAYGKCVSAAVSNAVSAQAKVTAAAAKSCKAALKASATAFAAKYGTFGKCVALASKSK
jgi:hypothetical protein